MRLVRIDAEVYVDDSHDGEDIALALWSLPGVVRVKNAEVAHVVIRGAEDVFEVLE